MIGFILLIGLLFRLIISHWGTYWGDMNSWIGWSNRLMVVGFKDFYQSWCDYLPGYLYILWLLGKIKTVFLSVNLDIPNLWLYKMPSMLADIGIGFLIYKIISRWRSQFIAVLAAAFYLFNPAVFANSTLWGQADGFFAFIIFLSLYLLIDKKLLLSAIIFGFACITKPLALFLLPLILLFLFFKKEYKQILLYPILASILVIISFIPFTNQNLIPFIFSRFMVTFNQYPYTSLNAFNFWGLVLPSWTQDKINFLAFSYQTWGIILFGIAYLVVAFNLMAKINVKNKENQNVYLLFSSTGLIFFSNFIFLTRMHERHSLPVLVFLNIAAVFNPLLGFVYLASSLIYIFNLRYAFINLTENFKTIFSPTIVQFLSFIQLINLFFYFLINKKPTLGNIRSNVKKSRFWKLFSYVNKIDRKISNDKEVKVKNGKFYLVLILIFAFVLRVWNIWYPKVYIFDEVYHGFTAQEMAKGNIMAWEWWNNPPKGFAYEWTHPPLAKLIMAGGILLFGKNDQVSQYTFRIPAVLFSLGVIYLIYLLTKELFKNERIGLWAAFLFSFDGLGFVMGRIGMADIYFLFFLLLTIYLLLKEKYFWSAMSLGLAIATKWTGIYLYPVIILILLTKLISNRKLSVTGLLIYWVTVFTLIPFLTYILIYLPFFTSGHTWNQFIELQKQMWWYHTNLKATHDYQSPAWTWPFMIRPVWFWVDYQQNSIANIYNLGNPLLWWSGLLVLPLSIYQVIENIIKKRNFNLALIIFCYFAFWLPWIFSPRIMFLHHYLPAIPFLCIIIAYCLDKIYDLRFKIYDKGATAELLITVYLLLITLSFFFFYPIYTGLTVPKDLVKFFFWLPSWR